MPSTCAAPAATARPSVARILTPAEIISAGLHKGDQPLLAAAAGVRLHALRKQLRGVKPLHDRVATEAQRFLSPSASAELAEARRTLPIAGDLAPSLTAAASAALRDVSEAVEAAALVEADRRVEAYEVPAIEGPVRRAVHRLLSLMTTARVAAGQGLA